MSAAATRAWYLPTCVNIATPFTSPIAQTFSAARSRSSTWTPCRVISTPSCSRPSSVRVRPPAGGDEQLLGVDRPAVRRVDADLAVRRPRSAARPTRTAARSPRSGTAPRAARPPPGRRAEAAARSGRRSSPASPSARRTAPSRTPRGRRRGRSGSPGSRASSWRRGSSSTRPCRARRWVGSPPRSRSPGRASRTRSARRPPRRRRAPQPGRAPRTTSTFRSCSHETIPESS